MWNSFSDIADIWHRHSLVFLF